MPDTGRLSQQVEAMTADQLPLFDQHHDCRYDHPAQFSWPILSAIAPILRTWRVPVHDCFAGPGIRLGQLCDRLGLAFSGVEIEAELIVDPRVHHGDATEGASYPSHVHVVVTSPTYGNGDNDHFQARDGSRRHTYRQHLATVLGQDRPLHPNNQGRYALVRGGRRKAAEYWRVANEAVGHWPERVVVNVSDFYNGGARYPLVEHWRALLAAHSYGVPAPIPVKTRRQLYGANRERAEVEALLVGRRRERRHAPSRGANER